MKYIFWFLFVIVGAFSLLFLTLGGNSRFDDGSIADVGAKIYSYNSEVNGFDNVGISPSLFLGTDNEISVLEISELDHVYFQSRNKSPLQLSRMKNGELNLVLGPGIYMFSLFDGSEVYEVYDLFRNTNFRLSGSGIFVVKIGTREINTYSYNAVFEYTLLHEWQEMTSFSVFPGMFMTNITKGNEDLKNADFFRVRTNGLNTVTYMDPSDDNIPQMIAGSDESEFPNYASLFNISRDAIRAFILSSNIKEKRIQNLSLPYLSSESAIKEQYEKWVRIQNDKKMATFLQNELIRELQKFFVSGAEVSTQKITKIRSELSDIDSATLANIDALIVDYYVTYYFLQIQNPDADFVLGTDDFHALLSEIQITPFQEGILSEFSRSFLIYLFDLWDEESESLAPRAFLQKRLSENIASQFDLYLKDTSISQKELFLLYTFLEIYLIDSFDPQPHAYSLLAKQLSFAKEYMKKSIAENPDFSQEQIQIFATIMRTLQSVLQIVTTTTEEYLFVSLEEDILDMEFLQTFSHPKYLQSLQVLENMYDEFIQIASTVFSSEALRASEATGAKRMIQYTARQHGKSKWKIDFFRCIAEVFSGGDQNPISVCK